MFIDTDPIKKIYLIEFRSSVAKFYCRNSIKQTVIEFYRNPSNVDFFRGPLFYDIAREMDQFFFCTCNGVHGCKFDSLYDWDRSGFNGNPFSSVLSFDVGIYRPVLSCGGKYFDFCYLMRTVLWKLFSCFTRKDFVTDTISK